MVKDKKSRAPAANPSMPVIAPARPIRNHLYAAVLICLAAGLAYSNIFEAPFVFDSVSGIVDKESLRIERLDIPTLYEVGSESGRPLTFVTFALNHFFGGYEVAGYHAVNLVIHMINAILVYLLSLLVFGRLVGSAPPDPSPAGEGGLSPDASVKAMALTAGLIFVVHPLQTQAVTYTVQRYTSMAAMFYLASVLLYLKSRSVAGRFPHKRLPGPAAVCLFVAAVFSGVMAMLCKQNAASLPGAILLAEFLIHDPGRSGWKERLVWVCAYSLLFLAPVFYFLGLVGPGSSMENLLEDVTSQMRETRSVGRWEYLCTQFTVIMIYLRLLVLPIQQNLDYLYPFTSSFFTGYTPYAFLALLVLAGIGFLSLKKRPLISFAVFWFFITLSVESSVMPIKDALFEHRLYLPLTGFALLVAFVIFHFLRKRRAAAIAVAAGIVLALGTLTYLRNQVWLDPVTLWADSVEKNPMSFRSRANLAIELQKQKRDREAVAQFKTALELRPRDHRLMTNLAAALIATGDLDQAIPHLLAALRIDPGYPNAHYHLGVALEQKGQFAEAAEHLKIVLDKELADVPANYHYALALVGKGDYESAKEHFLIVLQEKPDSVDALYNLGAIAFRQGRMEEARRYFDAVSQKQPDDAQLQYSLGIIAAHLNRPDDAIGHYMQAVRIDAGFAEAYNNLGVLLAQAGRYEEAFESFSAALRIRPDYQKAKIGLEEAMRQRDETP